MIYGVWWHCTPTSGYVYTQKTPRGLQRCYTDSPGGAHSDSWPSLHWLFDLTTVSGEWPLMEFSEPRLVGSRTLICPLSTNFSHVPDVRPMPPLCCANVCDVGATQERHWARSALDWWILFGYYCPRCIRLALRAWVTAVYIIGLLGKK